MVKRRIGAIEKDVIITGAIFAGIYIFIAKPLINLLGDDPEDKAEVKNFDETDLSVNFFSMQFQPYLAYLQSTWGTTDPSQDFGYWQGVKNNYDNGAYDNRQYTGAENAVDVALGAEIIYSAFGFWKWASDITGVKTVLMNVKTQLTVTLMAAYFLANFQTDLYQWLKDGSTARIKILQARNGLNDTDLAAIIRYIEQLPETTNF